MLLNFLPPIISASVVAPSITDQPDTIEVYEGQTATFTVIATGSGLFYQWQKSDNAGVDWSDISGATSSSYTTAVTVRTTDNNDQFRCVVTNSAGTVNSNAATLTVWSPAALTGLQLWLDASDSSTVLEGAADPAEANDPVSQWSDKSGNVRHATQGTLAARPVYRSAAQNGRNVLEWDGTDDFLSVGAVATFKHLHDGTASLVCIVARPGLVANPNAIYAFIDNCGVSSGSIGYSLAYDDRASVPRNNVLLEQVSKGSLGNPSISNLSGDAWTPNVFSIIDDCMDADNATASQRSKVRINNGTEIANNALTNTPSASNATAVLRLGSSSTGTFFLAGQIAEVIICNNQNASLLTKLRGYLAWKWGITIA